MDDKYYLFMIDGQMMPVRVLSKRVFSQVATDNDYAKARRFVRYEYLKLDNNKRLVYGEGKQSAAVFSKFAAKITKKEFEEKTLTLRTLYSNSDGNIPREEDFYWSTGD